MRSLSKLLIVLSPLLLATGVMQTAVAAEDGSTVFSAGMVNYTGNKNEGFYQTMGTVVSIKSYSNPEVFSWYSSLEGEFSSDSTYFTDKKRSYSYTGISLGLGPVICFNPKTHFSPSIEFGPKFGFGNLSISNAPASVASSSAGISYGGEGTLSGRLGSAKGFKIIVFMSYRILFVSKLASVEGWQSNATIVGGAIGF